MTIKEKSAKLDKTNHISLQDIKVTLGGKEILKGISFDVKKGEILQIIGPSGCGKSVTIKVVLSMLQPDSGTVKVQGEPKIGMLFQYGALFDSLKVWENISFYQMQHNLISKDAARTLAIKYLKQVGLSEDLVDNDPSELSGGMKKRVALARALAVKPDILICDEPTSGLDPVTGSYINDLIAKVTGNNKCTTIIVTHDIATIAKIGGNVVMLYEGKIVWQGKASKAKSSKNPYINQFVTSSINGPITAGQDL